MPPRAEPEPQSPLVPLLAPLALALTAAALVPRLFTNGAGLELQAPGTQILFDALAFAAASTWSLTRALQGRPAFGVSRLALTWVLAFLALTALGAARAPHPDIAWRTWRTWAALSALGLAIADMARDPRILRALLGLLLGAALGVAGLALHGAWIEGPRLRAAFLAGDLRAEFADLPAGLAQMMTERILDPVAVGPFLLPALLACACGLTLPLALAAARAPGPRLHRALRLLLPAALLVAAVETRSKGGAITVLAALAAYVVTLPRFDRSRTRWLVGGGALAALAGLALALTLRQNPEALGASLAVRVEYWAAGASMWQEHPWLGAGTNQFRVLFPVHKSAHAEEALHAHNMWVQTLAEFGVVGLCLWVLGAFAWARGVREAWRARAEPGTEEGPGGAQAGACVLVGALLGWLHLWGFGDAYDATTPWHLFGVAVALVAGVRLWGRLTWPPGVVVGAAAAGLVASWVDGLSSFGAYQAGVVALSATLLGVLESQRPARALPRAVDVGLVGLLGGLTLWTALGVAPPRLEADRARSEGAALGQSAGQVAPTRRAALLVEAFEAYDRGRTLAPSDADLHRAAASVAAAADDLETAQRATEAALVWVPLSASTWAELGRYAGQAGAWERAEEAYAEAVRWYPFHPQHWLEFAELEAARGGEETEEGRGRIRERLERSRAASEATRLQARKLTESERERWDALWGRVAEGSPQD